MDNSFLEQLLFFQNPKRQDFVTDANLGAVDPMLVNNRAPAQNANMKPSSYSVEVVKEERRPSMPKPIPVEQPFNPQPQAMSPYDKMMDEILKEKRGSIEGVQKQLETAQAGGHWSDKLNLAPLAAYLDSTTGSRLLPAFQGPTPFEERQGLVSKLDQTLREQKDEYANTALNFFKNKAYMDQVKAQQENANADRDFDRWYKKEDLKLQQAKASGQTGKPSKGLEELDKAFAKTYQEEFLSGKIASAENNLQKLADVGAQLNVRDDLTGGAFAYQPMFIRERFSPDSANAQQTVEEVVQQSLKAILGAQFTQKEADRLIERAYNPKMDETYNAERVRRLYGALKQGIERKKAAGEFFEKNGYSLDGFSGVNPLGIDSTSYVDSILRDLEGGGNSAPKDKKSRLEELKNKAKGN